MLQEYTATMLQAYSAARGEVGTTTIPRRGRWLVEALLAIAAIVVIVAVMALMTRGVLAPTSSGLGAQDANLKAGASTAIVHDDAGNMPLTGTGPAVVHDDAGNMPLGTDSALVHDDAGNMPIGAGSSVVHDDAGNLKSR